MAIKIRIVSDFDKKGMTEAEKALNNLSNAAGVALAAVGAAMVGIGVKSVQEFAKFDAALVKSQAIMGDLSETMKKDMSDAAREVAKVTTFSAEQAAESFFFLASAGLDAESSIRALPQVAQFAQAGMFDMALATDLLTDAQSALGLTIRNDAVKNMENMVKVSDVLVRANTLANASVEQFSTSLTTKAGASLRALGKDVEEGVAVLAAFADQGIKGEEAGTQLSIVLRDLTTKALKNKDAFKEMGITVFDSNGEMANLGNIIADLEGALAGMSDETQKATLLQLGFSDKSLASLQALLGTSEAIKTYEKELRSASGFTENVATKQLDTFNSQMKLLESAVVDVAIQIGEELTPYLADLIPVLQELLPQIGRKLADAIKTVDWAGLIEDVAEFFTTFVENIDTITRVATNLGILAAGIIGYTTAVKIATTATAILNGTMLLNPFIAMAAFIATTTFALTNFAAEQKRVREESTGLTGRTAEINAEFARLEELLDSGVISYSQYRAEVDPLIVELSRLEGQTGATTGEAGRFNRELQLINSEKMRKQMALARIELQKFNNTVFTGTGGTADWLNEMFGTGPKAKPTGDDILGLGGGPSAFEQARSKVQDLIKSSQKQLESAQDRYSDSVKSARENYANNILAIEKDFAGRLANIVQQSQDRLRSAYRSAVEENIAALFDRSEDKSVEGLVKSLSDKLTASRRLLENSAQLASQGFSQTFIEQVVSAGTQTGNELASAILNSTPETKSELQKLFTALEVEASSGMDSLAKEIYDKQGLATQELKNLYAQTGKELETALFAQQMTLANALEDSATTLYESVKGIRENFNEEIDAMGDKLGGMAKLVKDFQKLLGATESKAIEEAFTAATMPGGSATTKAVEAAASAINGAAGIFIDSASDIDNVVSYLDDRIANAERYLKSSKITEVQRASALQTLGELSSQRSTVAAAGEAAVGTVININVKADTSQSLAMVGKSLGNTVAKYVTGGGQVIVSPV